MRNEKGRLTSLRHPELSGALLDTNLQFRDRKNALQRSIEFRKIIIVCVKISLVFAQSRAGVKIAESFR